MSKSKRKFELEEKLQILSVSLDIQKYGFRLRETKLADQIRSANP
jgi:hypothetical protein